jgi:hypothetical protein
MLAFRSVVSVLVRFAVRSFSTNSRPALRAAACGGRPRAGSDAAGTGNRPSSLTVSLAQPSGSGPAVAGQVKSTYSWLRARPWRSTVMLRKYSSGALA